MVRIIGGKWCGRLIKFAARSNLRPTPNRIRETLFNWLAQIIVDSICLDMFAGSGALGFEALSRGAKHVVMMEESKKTIADLTQNAKLLKAENIEFINKSFHHKLVNPFNTKFNIVFLDPPFHQNLVPACCQWLEGHDCLTEDAFIYVECEKTLSTILVPLNWQLYRKKIAGQVCYSLWQRSAG